MSYTVKFWGRMREKGILREGSRVRKGMDRRRIRDSLGSSKCFKRWHHGIWVL